MAKTGSLIGLGIAGVAGYFLYQWLTTPTAASVPAGGIIPATVLPPGATSTAYVPPTLAQQLLSAAQGNAYLINSKMNPWQWSYVLQNGLNKPAPDQSKFGAAFFPSGTPSLSGANCEKDPPPAGCPQLITADQFTSALGLSGLSGPRRVRVRTAPRTGGYVPRFTRVA